MPLRSRPTDRYIASEGSRRLVFLHIPKTAGTTLHTILRRQYSVENRFEIDALDLEASLTKYRSLSKDQAEQITLIHGHCADRLYDWIPAPYDVCAFFRDPIDHVLSSFAYLKRATWNPTHHVVKNMETIEEFVEFRQKTGNDSPQARYLAGLTIHHSEDFRDVDSQEIRKRAFHHLKALSLVFDLDHFDEALLILKRQFNWRTPYYRVQNVSRKLIVRDALSEDCLAKIKSLVEVDLDIYEEARNRMRHDFGDLLDSVSFKRSLKKFQSANKLLGLLPKRLFS